MNRLSKQNNLLDCILLFQDENWLEHQKVLNDHLCRMHCHGALPWHSSFPNMVFMPLMVDLPHDKIICLGEIWGINIYSQLKFSQSNTVLVCSRPDTPFDLAFFFPCFPSPHLYLESSQLFNQNLIYSLPQTIPILQVLQHLITLLAKASYTNQFHSLVTKFLQQFLVIMSGPLGQIPRRPSFSRPSTSNSLPAGNPRPGTIQPQVAVLSGSSNNGIPRPGAPRPPFPPYPGVPPPSYLPHSPNSVRSYGSPYPLVPSPSSARDFAQVITNADAKVIEYLVKKGYNRTEQMLRSESSNLDRDGKPIQERAEDLGTAKYAKGFRLLSNWIESNLDIYKVSKNHFSIES